MKTLSEVIFEAPYSPTPWEADAINYLREYRDKAHRLDIEIADHRRSFEQLGVEIARYQEAVRNCEEAENNFKKLYMQFEFFRQDYEVLKVRQAEQQANSPLTWDELKSMEGRPVWVEYSGYTPNWEIVENIGAVRGSTGDFTGNFIETNKGVLHKNKQGTAWQAYRKERK